MGWKGAFAVVDEMSEQHARAALAEKGVSAADPEYYEALRVRGGWSFRWREDAGPPRPGTIGWVVADNGRCRGQPLWTTAEEVVQSLLVGRPVARPWE